MMTRREIAAGAAALVAGCATGSGANSAPVVETTHGKIRGAVSDGVQVFKGIPYGASTAGAARFKPPQPPRPWSGVRDCINWGPNAPQLMTGPVVPTGMGDQMREFFGFTPDVPTEQSEDCLVLNVFTPDASRARKRPVMVWFHGGGFEVGTGSGSRANGVNLAKRYDVVTVTINHRLGVLGYCDLSSFGDDYARSGNCGQLDLILALQWVRNNIEAFGGDPAKVMIHGESGGGAKVGAMLAMPGGAGLFSRAICQSGTPSRLPGHEQGAAAAAALLRELQIAPADVTQLQNVSAEDLMRAGQRATASLGGPMSGRGFAPLVGGADLPVEPFAAVAAGCARDIPLIIGCAKHEAELFLAGGGVDTANLSEAQVQQMAPMSLGPQAAALLEGYRANHPDYTPGQLLVRAMTDSMMRYPSIKFAEAHIRGGGAATFMYLFTWESPVLPHLHAAHGIDGTFYFANTETVNIAAGNAEAQALSAKTSEAWATFARDGAPAAAALPAWPQYGLERRETMIFSAEPHIESDPLSADRQMRDRLAN